MAKSKTIWISKDGTQYDTETEAIRADAREAACQVLKNTWTDAGIDLTKIESFNHQALKPVYDYFEGLMLASIERTKRHG